MKKTKKYVSNIILKTRLANEWNIFCINSRLNNDYPLSSGNHWPKFGNYQANGSI